MHYLNGRLVSLGDWVVGPTHNSDNRIVCGLVVELMPKQGSCNVKLHAWKDEHFMEEGEPCTIRAVSSSGYDDYADCKRLIKVEDGLRMVKAVVQFGTHDSSYLI